MRKNNTHDYAISALFMYAKENFPKSDDIAAQLKNAEQEYLDYVRQTSPKPLKLTARRMSDELAYIRSVYLDVLAIENSIMHPETEKEKSVLECIKRVYFEAGKHGTRKGLIDSLCVRCSMDMHMSVSNVYILLAEGLRKFCVQRGLRIDPGSSKSIKTLKRQ